MPYERVALDDDDDPVVSVDFDLFTREHDGPRPKTIQTAPNREGRDGPLKLPLV